MSRNKCPEPIKTTKHTEQCPRCRWWFTPRGIKRHVCLADYVPRYEYTLERRTNECASECEAERRQIETGKAILED